MKVFKFYSEEYHYTQSGVDEEQALNSLFENVGKFKVIKSEEVPESEWDKKDIVMYDDNDTETEPYYTSIREVLGDEPELICTNDHGAIGW